MRYIEQFVNERQEIKPLRMCVSYFLTFQTNIISYGISVIRFALQKTTVYVDKVFLLLS